MGFRLRQTDGSYYTSATWIDPNGSATSYANGAFEADPVAISDVGGRDVPTTWNVRLPDRRSGCRGDCDKPTGMDGYFSPLLGGSDYRSRQPYRARLPRNDGLRLAYKKVRQCQIKLGSSGQGAFVLPVNNRTFSIPLFQNKPRGTVRQNELEPCRAVS